MGRMADEERWEGRGYVMVVVCDDSVVLLLFVCDGSS